MKHTHAISRRRPLPAFYYQISLTQKLTELATFASFADAAVGVVKGLFTSSETR